MLIQIIIKSCYKRCARPSKPSLQSQLQTVVLPLRISGEISTSSEVDENCLFQVPNSFRDICSKVSCLRSPQRSSSLPKKQRVSIQLCEELK